MIIRNARVFIDGKFNECDVRTENGLITEIGKNLEGEGYDRKGQYLFAGFIDTHFHGACNVYCGDSLESMREIARTIPQYGVTSYVPTYHIFRLEIYEFSFLTLDNLSGKQ